MTPTTEYRLIPLTKGQHAIVDASDFEWLSQWKWCVNWGQSRKFYAVRNVWADGKRRTISMQRLILGLEFGDKRQGDHINRNTLDNRRENLRIATVQQNQCNKGMAPSNTSGYKGVAWHKRYKRWGAWIKVQGRVIWLGHFDTREAAHAAYCKAAAQLHGEFARTA